MDASTSGLRGRFESDGFVCLRGVLPLEECQRWLAAMTGEQAGPLEWFKGYAATCRSYYDAAVDWRLVEPLRALLGPEFILWGISLVRREPGQVHAWHSDMESALSGGPTVSVWLGLEHTSPETSLTVLPGSHRVGHTIQEMAAAHRVSRDAIRDEHVTDWASQAGIATSPALVAMTDGDALFFDGRLWHASRNLDDTASRTALLLQYARSDTRVKRVDFSQLEWPLPVLDAPLPPCLRVQGPPRPEYNRLVPPPMYSTPEGSPWCPSQVTRLEMPLLRPGEEGKRSVTLVRGHTHTLGDFSCHASALPQGACPHPPHQHPEEELLLVLAGRVELSLPLATAAQGGPVQSLEAGQMVYYPAGFYHTLKAVSADPAHYLMIKWLGDGAGESPGMPFATHHFHATSGTLLSREEGFKPRLVFEQSTDWLSKCHCHLTELQPGAGYPPHADDYDVILLVLEGQVETLGQVAGPHAVVYYAAGEKHGMHNPGPAPAKYVVFEFHGSTRAKVRLGKQAAQPRLTAEVRALRKEAARLRQEIKRLKARPPRLRWHQKLLSKSRWHRRLHRWGLAPAPTSGD